jgi:hypothetical protein
MTRNLCLALTVAAIGALVLSDAAAATTVTSNEGFTPTIKATSSGHVILHGANGITVECSSSLEAKIEEHGLSVTAEGWVSSLSFSSCTPRGTHPTTVHVYLKDKLILHASGSGNATVTSMGMEFEATVPIAGGTISCIYTTLGTDLGTLTGSTTTGGKATVDLNASIPRTGGSILCGSTGNLTGAYVVNSPTSLNLD